MCWNWCWCWLWYSVVVVNCCCVGVGVGVVGVVGVGVHVNIKSWILTIGIQHHIHPVSVRMSTPERHELCSDNVRDREMHRKKRMEIWPCKANALLLILCVVVFFLPTRHGVAMFASSSRVFK